MTTTRSRAWGKVIKIGCAGILAVGYAITCQSATCNEDSDLCVKQGQPKIDTMRASLKRACESVVRPSSLPESTEQKTTPPESVRRSIERCIANIDNTPEVTTLVTQIKDECERKRVACHQKPKNENQKGM